MTPPEYNKIKEHVVAHSDLNIDVAAKKLYVHQQIYSEQFQQTSAKPA